MRSSIGLVCSKVAWMTVTENGHDDLGQDFTTPSRPHTVAAVHDLEPDLCPAL